MYISIHLKYTYVYIFIYIIHILPYYFPIAYINYYKVSDCPIDLQVRNLTLG